MDVGNGGRESGGAGREEDLAQRGWRASGSNETAGFSLPGEASAGLHTATPHRPAAQGAPSLPPRRARGRDAGSRGHTEDARSGSQSPTPVPPRQLMFYTPGVLARFWLKEKIQLFF